MKVSIITLNYNRKNDTIECLKSIDRLRIYGYELEIIVVDNASNDGSIEELNKLKSPSFRLIKNTRNLGFTAGNNEAIKLALEGGADWILLLNNDTLVDRSLLVNLLKTTETNKEIGIVSPKIYFAPGYEYHKDKYPKGVLGKVIWSAGGKMDWNNVFGVNVGVDDVDRGQYEKEGEMDFATGAAVLVRKDVFEKVGLFDEKYFMYFEDTDFCKRATQKGFKIYYSPKAIIWHKVGQGSGIGSSLNDYFIARNRMLFGMKYASSRTKLALIRESLRLLVTGRKWQRKGIRDFYINRFYKGSF